MKFSTTKKTVLLFLFFSTVFHQSLKAQRVRVYESFDLNTAFKNKLIVPSLAYMQRLALGKHYQYRIISGIRFSQFFVPTATLNNQNSIKTSTITLLKNTSSTTINIPLGVELGTKMFAVGISSDILGYTIGKQLDATYFDISQSTTQPTDLQASMKGYNFIGGKKGTFNSELYAAVTFNETFTIKAGVSALRYTYNTTYASSSTTRSKWDSFQEKSIVPFVGLRFNFEK